MGVVKFPWACRRLLWALGRWPRHSLPCPLQAFPRLGTLYHAHRKRYQNALRQKHRGRGKVLREHGKVCHGHGRVLRGQELPSTGCPGVFGDGFLPGHLSPPPPPGTPRVFTVSGLQVKELLLCVLSPDKKDVSVIFWAWFFLLFSGCFSLVSVGDGLYSYSAGSFFGPQGPPSSSDGV